MNKKYVGIVALVLLILGGVSILYSNVASQAVAQNVAPTSLAQQPESVEKKAFSIEEVNKHANENDCWLAIEGKVYNVTPFIASGKHPGGKAILQGCGKDATAAFNSKPGTGRSHSAQARAGLANFYIGDLQ